MKNKSKFNEKLGIEFPFLKQVGSERETCTKCLSTFAIHRRGCSGLTTHMKSRKHRSAEEPLVYCSQMFWLLLGRTCLKMTI